MKKNFYFPISSGFSRCVVMIILSLTVYVSAHAQLGEKFVPPTPTSAELIKAASTEVAMYSGRLNLQIPLTSLKEGNLQTDVVIKYTGSSGIKVQDYAGAVGLGFSLSAGGVITRTCKGLPDDKWKGFCVYGQGGKLASDPNSDNYKSAFVESGSDLSPDIFTSTVGGSIVFTANKVPFFTENMECKILQNGVFSPDSTWVIQDSKGTKYYFGKNASDREHSYSITEQSGISGESYTSSWFLSEMVSPEGNKISFSYQKGPAKYYEYYTQYKDDKNFRGVASTDRYSNNFKNVIYDPVRLHQVTTTNHHMVFEYVMRWDIAGDMALSSITVSDLQNNLTERIKLNLGYFTESVVNPYARLKLIGIDRYNLVGTKTVPLARFYYNEITNLPNRKSNQFDAWGYYNNNSNSSTFTSEGANRSPSFEGTIANILTGVQWPTRELLTFEYEQNNCFENGVVKYLGGVRIKSETSSVDGVEKKRVNYYYNLTNNLSSGLRHNNFDESLGYISEYSTLEITQETLSNGTPVTNYENVLHRVESSTPIAKMFDLQEMSVGYSRVTKEQVGNGKEVFEFSDFNAFPDEMDGLVYAGVGAPNTVPYFYNFSQFNPTYHKNVTSFTSKAFRRGLLSNTEVVDNAGVLIQKISNSYSSVSGVSLNAAARLPSGTITSIYGLYREIQSVPLLIKTVDSKLDRINNQWVDKVTRKEYHQSIPSLLRKVIFSDSGSDSLFVSYRYPIDLSQTEPVINNLVAFNMLNPLETVSGIKITSGELIKSSVLNLFNNINVQGSLVPLLTRKLSLKINQPISDYFYAQTNSSYDGRLTDDYFADSYNNLGRMTEFHKNAAAHNAILWDPTGNTANFYAENSSADRILFDNGELIFNPSNWTSGGGSVLSSEAYSGLHAWHSYNGNKVLPTGDYFVSYQYKGLPLQLSGNNVSITSSLISPEDTRGWKNAVIGLSALSGTSLNILSTEQDGNLYDDMMIFPANSHPSAFVYDNTAKLVSKTNPQGNTEFYSYDDFGMIETIRDLNYNIVKATAYNYVDVSKWENTGNTRCVATSTGWYSGEKEVEQRDINSQSPTYNQIRWRSIGLDPECAPTVYARIRPENVIHTNDGGPEFTIADVVVRFFKDPQCTIPHYAQSIEVVSPVSNNTVLCSGYSTKLDVATYPGYYNFEFHILPFWKYIAVY